MCYAFVLESPTFSFLRRIRRGLRLAFGARWSSTPTRFRPLLCYMRLYAGNGGLSPFLSGSQASKGCFSPSQVRLSISLLSCVNLVLFLHEVPPVVPCSALLAVCLWRWVALIGRIQSAKLIHNKKKTRPATLCTSCLK